MKLNKFVKVGPFRYFRVKTKRKNFLDIALICLGDFPLGWEWGTDDEPTNPSWEIKLNHFRVFSYEKFSSGFTIYFLGFWWVK